MAKHVQQSAILQELIELHQLAQGDPCSVCIYALYRTTMYQWPKPVCVRCYPPRGYHEWSDQVDASIRESAPRRASTCCCDGWPTVTYRR